MKEESQKPENEFKAGAVRASIWSKLRKTGNGNFFNSRKVVLERIYKDAQGNFKTTNSLDLNDIPKAILVLGKAYEYLMTADRKTESTESFEKDDLWVAAATAQTP